MKYEARGVSIELGAWDFGASNGTLQYLYMMGGGPDPLNELSHSYAIVAEYSSIRPSSQCHRMDSVTKKRGAR